MTSDLVSRMRTCAVFMQSILVEATDLDGDVVLTARVPRDAIALLNEGADALQKYRPDETLSEPMEILEPLPKKISPPPSNSAFAGTWIGTDLPPVSPKVCPSCGSTAHKNVGRANGRFVLKCPNCSHIWPLTRG